MHVTEWEYRVEETQGGGLHNGQLRNLGAKGWELVSETVLPDPKANGGYRLRAVFKQPRR